MLFHNIAGSHSARLRRIDGTFRCEITIEMKRKILTSLFLFYHNLVLDAKVVSTNNYCDFYSKSNFFVGGMKSISVIPHWAGGWKHWMVAAHFEITAAILGISGCGQMIIDMSTGRTN